MQNTSLFFLTEIFEVVCLCVCFVSKLIMYLKFVLLKCYNSVKGKIHVICLLRVKCLTVTLRWRWAIQTPFFFLLCVCGFFLCTSTDFVSWIVTPYFCFSIIYQYYENNASTFQSDIICLLNTMLSMNQLSLVNFLGSLKSLLEFLEIIVLRSANSIMTCYYYGS